MCPVCTLAVCAGFGLSRWLGVDDIVSGIWIGGLLASALGSFFAWLKKKGLFSYFGGVVLAIVFYSLIITPLYLKKIIGQPENKLCLFKQFFLDKLVFGIILGGLVLLLGVFLNNYLKKKNNNQVFFPFQKVVLPFLFLFITSLIFYLIYPN